MKKMLAIVFALAFAAMPTASAGETMESLIQQVDNAQWGASADEVSQTIRHALAAQEKILVSPETLLGTVGTLNHLFNDADKLYNVSWYTVIPVAEMGKTEALWGEIVRSLTGKFRKPKNSERQGDLARARDIAHVAPELLAAREKVAALMSDKTTKPDPAAMKEAMGEFSLIDVIPTLFYSEQHYWETRPLRIYAALFCSTDGSCYVHVNFISKRQAGKDAYPDGNRKMFSYSPLDRDQDAITAANAPLF